MALISGYPLCAQFYDLYRMLPEQGDPLGCEFCYDVEKLNGRPNRRQPLAEFKRKLHISLCHFRQLCLISPHISGGWGEIKSFPQTIIRYRLFVIFGSGCYRMLESKGGP